MGVKLHDLLIEHDLAHAITLESLDRKTIAIDAMNTLYQFLAIIRGNDHEPLKDVHGNITSHLSGFFYRTLKLIEYGIKPVYVFDGKPHQLKEKEIKRRKEVRKIAEHKAGEAEDADDDDALKTAAQGSIKVNEAMINDSKELLKAMGLPIVTALQDGEAQAAYMVQKGDAWAMATQDYDSFLYGSPRVIRNLSQNRTRHFSGRTVEINIERYDLNEILTALAISRDQLIDLALLVGTDFYQGVDGVASKTAYKLIREHGSLQNIIEQKVVIRKKEIDLPKADAMTIHDIFQKPAITDDYDLKFTKLNPEKVKRILVDQHSFSDMRISSAVESYTKRKNEQRQGSLDQFF